MNVLQILFKFLPFREHQLRKYSLFCLLSYCYVQKVFQGQRLKSK